MVVNRARIPVEDSRGYGPFRMIVVNGKSIQVELVQELSRDPVHLLLRIGNRTLSVAVAELQEDEAVIRLNGRPLEVRLEYSPTTLGDREKTSAQAGPVVVNAPMSGRITALKTAPGVTVVDGEALLVLEAMKMENEIAAPKKGIVREIYVKPGALVKTGDKLVLVD